MIRHEERMKQVLVGLTGNFGSGKSTVLKMFRELGALTFSADELVHGLLNRNDIKKEIRKIFGAQVFNGSDIDRRELARKAFSSKKLRMKLEEILHPLVYKRVGEFRREYPERIIVAEIPLLFETGRQRDFDFIILVTCPRGVAIERLEKRGFASREVQRRLKAQMPMEEKIKYSDFVVDNSGTLAETRRQVKKIWEKLTYSGGPAGE